MTPLERLTEFAQKPVRLAVGLMSGMSRDGIDLALVRLTGDRPKVELLFARTAPYGDAMRVNLSEVLDAPPQKVASLDFELGELWAREVSRFLGDVGVPAGDVDVLGSHGQTIAHVPRWQGTKAATLQIGQADVLAARTGILTVSDFRPADIAAGGEGAPLVAFADWVLHAEPGRVIACHNLGSIANVTVVPERFEDVVAFDTGPANTLIDCFCARAGEEMDRDGSISAAGQIDEQVLSALFSKRQSWLSQQPPRSAGFQTFGPELAEEVCVENPGVAPADLVRTAVEFTARTIADAYEQLLKPRFPKLSRVQLSGGGCHNQTLLAAIDDRLGSLGLEITTSQAWVDSKEAVAFALLADAALRGRCNNVPGATGGRPVVMGKLSLADK